MGGNASLGFIRQVEDTQDSGHHAPIYITIPYQNVIHPVVVDLNSPNEVKMQPLLPSSVIQPSFNPLEDFCQD